MIDDNSSIYSCGLNAKRRQQYLKFAWNRFVANFSNSFPYNVSIGKDNALMFADNTINYWPSAVGEFEI